MELGRHTEARLRAETSYVTTEAKTQPILSANS